MFSQYSFFCREFSEINYELSENISNSLIAFGFSPQYKGYFFVRDSLFILQIRKSDIDKLNLIRDVFPFLSMKYKTSIIDIDRNFNLAIQKAVFNFNCLSCREHLGYDCDCMNYLNSLSTKSVLKFINMFI